MQGIEKLKSFSNVHTYLGLQHNFFYQETSYMYVRKTVNKSWILKTVNGKHSSYFSNLKNRIWIFGSDIKHLMSWCTCQYDIITIIANIYLETTNSKSWLKKWWKDSLKLVEWCENMSVRQKCVSYMVKSIYLTSFDFDTFKKCYFLK